MEYTALYRKYRPSSFQGVIGQNSIVKTLKNQVINGRISHAYLFCGTRGTGKTSIAKIFAKTINCLNPKDGEPCNECEMCTSANSGSNINIAEIDAASNNKVDDARVIIDEVKYPPVNGKYKVYIIDEVHMLTIQAFNALLKTLEEPPEYAVFILATTDPQKVPVTILSRCQRYDFKRIPQSEIAGTLKLYMQKENTQIDDDAAEYIAAVSDGAMRDSLSILDQCMAYYSGEVITLEKVIQVTGSVDKSIFFDFTDALSDFDSKRCMDIISEAVINGRDVTQMINELIQHFRNDLVAASGGKIDTTAENNERYFQQGQKAGKNALIKYITSFSELSAKIKYSSSPRTLFEVECIKLCNALDEDDVVDVMQRISLLEKKLESGVVSTRIIEKKTQDIQPETQQTEFEPIREKIEPQLYKKIQSLWSKIMKNSGIKANFNNKSNPYKPCYLEDKYIYITYPDGGGHDVEDIFRKNALDDAEKIGIAISNEVKMKITVKVLSEREYERKERELCSKPSDKTEQELEKELSSDEMAQDLSRSFNGFDVEVK